LESNDIIMLHFCCHDFHYNRIITTVAAVHIPACRLQYIDFVSPALIQFAPRESLLFSTRNGLPPHGVRNGRHLKRDLLLLEKVFFTSRNLSF
jgi:hypothetical protein